MSESIEMSLGVALVLDEVVRKVLYAIKEENGQKVIVDRDLPFRLRYRLNKDKMMLDKDADWFERQKMLLLAQYGESSDDGQSVVIKDEGKKDLYKQGIESLIDTKITHDLVTLEPEDVDLIKDPDITVSPDAMTLFIGYLTNDPDLDRDLSFNIRVHDKEEPVVSSPAVEEPKPTTEPAVESEPAVDNSKEEPVKKTKRTTKKKSDGEATKKSAPKKTTKKKDA